MKTETNLDLTAKTDLVQLTDDEIDNVGGGFFLGLWMVGFVLDVYKKAMPYTVTKCV
jgi:hypothetical protein